MYNIYYVFHCKNKTIQGSDILSIQISEQEGSLPELVMSIFCNDFPTNITNCEVFTNSKLLFSGNIKSWRRVGRIITLTLVSNTASEIQPKRSKLNELLFGQATPSVQETLETTYHSLQGHAESVSLLDKNYIDINDIEDAIVAGSFKATKHNSEIENLEITVTASWLSREYGDFDLSSAINAQFNGGKVNTLTPLKLESAWPKQWERISSVRHGSGNKYFVSLSKLKLADTLHTDQRDIQMKLMIDDQKFIINRYIYDCKLVISYGYNQYRKETLVFNVNNNRKGVKKQIKINLGNISEFINDACCTSFFSTKFGNDVYKRIVELSKNYVWLSNRNIKFSWEMAYTPNLSCKTNIKIGDRIAKITSIKSYNLRTMLVTALGFADNTKPASYTIDDISITKPQPISINDVIQGIYVANDGIEQMDKLQDFITHSELTAENCQREITKFLNSNQTTITIVTKPVKRNFCEHTKIKTEQPHFI